MKMTEFSKEELFRSIQELERNRVELEKLIDKKLNLIGKLHIRVDRLERQLDTFMSNKSPVKLKHVKDGFGVKYYISDDTDDTKTVI